MDLEHTQHTDSLSLMLLMVLYQLPIHELQVRENDSYIKRITTDGMLTEQPQQI